MASNISIQAFYFVEMFKFYLKYEKYAVSKLAKFN